MKLVGTTIAFCFFLAAFAWSQEENPCQLFEDLLIVDHINRQQADRLPVFYNNILQGGYISMPSCRMGKEGELGFSFAQVPPYRHWNLRCQYTPFLELTGNYRVFRGIEDKALTSSGFGDFSDKGVNLKVALWQPEDTAYQLPGLALGADDILGTRAFKSFYCVFSYIWPKINLEASLGWGCHRIRGFFGGVHWMPLRHSNTIFNSVALAAEYDAIPYRDKDIEKHPKGRVKHSPINFGVKWRLFDNWDLSASFIRGKAFSFSAGTFFNFGETKGLLPKKDNPLPYRAPINTEPIGSLRSEDLLTSELLFAFNQQRFTVLEIALGYEGCQENLKKVLKIDLINETYRTLVDVKERLDALIATITPQDIDVVDIVLECESFPIQKYRYRMPFVQKFAEKKMGFYELGILTAAKDIPFCSKDQGLWPLFANNRRGFDYIFYPKTETLFGSAKGKFKYALGLAAAIEGFFPPHDIFWKVCVGWLPISKLYNIHSTDRINPSQLIEVRTDIIRYYQNKYPTLDQAYLQKNWTIGKGWFARASLGYFEMAYGGVAGQILYFPVNSFWAFGLEGALVKKRHYTGVTFTNKIRKLKGFEVTHRRFFGSQYFASLYFNLDELKLNLKIQGGQFLAKDYGVRFELMRYFPSGLELTLWYTITNGHDIVNGQIYYDKGVSMSMPLDIFFLHSARDRFGYSISAWLRDVGASAATGRDLYESIQSQRAIR